MQNRKLASFAMVIVAGALLHAPSAVLAAGAPAPPPRPTPDSLKTYTCQAEGSLIIPIAATQMKAASAFVAPARGTALLTGTGLGNLTAGYLLLSVTDSHPTAPAAGVPTVETCFYTVTAPITFAGPPVAIFRFWTLTAPLALDVTDSGADCPDPLAANPLNLALTHVTDVAGPDHFVGTDFGMTTFNDPGVDLTFTCSRRDVLPGPSVNWPAYF
jgi:hypothetical protein